MPHSFYPKLPLYANIPAAGTCSRDSHTGFEQSRLSLSSLSPSWLLVTATLFFFAGHTGRNLSSTHRLSADFFLSRLRTFTIFSSLFSHYRGNCRPIAPSRPRTPAAPRNSCSTQRNRASDPRSLRILLGHCPPCGEIVPRIGVGKQ